MIHNSHINITTYKIYLRPIIYKYLILKLHSVHIDGGEQKCGNQLSVKVYLSEYFHNL